MQQGRVVVRDGTDEHTGPAPCQCGRDGARVLQRLPGEFEHEPLLRVHGRGFPRRDAEELRVESIDLARNPPRPDSGVSPVVRQRASDISVMASTPSRRSFQNASGVDACGRRQDSPTTAIGSFCISGFPDITIRIAFPQKNQRQRIKG